MKKFYFLITSSFALFISADTVLEEAKNMLDLDAKPIEVIYDNDLVTSVCPKGSVGCFINDKKASIYIRDDISKDHHNVVLFGMYSDYLQFSNNGLIDPSLTCDLKVNYLSENRKSHLANLYRGYCDKTFKGKVIVLK